MEAAASISSLLFSKFGGSRLSFSAVVCLTGMNNCKKDIKYFVRLLKNSVNSAEPGNKASQAK